MMRRETPEVFPQLLGQVQVSAGDLNFEEVVGKRSTARRDSRTRSPTRWLKEAAVTARHVRT